MGVSPLKVGIVGTGYAAQRRAESFQADKRAHLLYFSGNSPAGKQTFAQNYSLPPLESASALVNHPDLDLVVIANINSEHEGLVRTALENDKHVIVEYPLAFSSRLGKELVALAQARKKLLHVEHIELLGGLHQGIKAHLPEIGQVYYGRYSTLMPQSPAPLRWTYQEKMFGFPLIAALSRIHRWIDLFGSVSSVNCRSHLWEAAEPEYFRACLCDAQLTFQNGLIVQITYGKGETLWKTERDFLLYGEKGALSFVGENGLFIRAQTEIPLEISPRRGLFGQDTSLVLDYLYEGKPLYVQVEQSLYALRVAEAAQQSAQTGKTVHL
jgi:biliverdin reductase